MARELLGGLLLACPFVILVIVLVRVYGWWITLLAFGITTITIVVITVGVALISGG